MKLYPALVSFVLLSACAKAPEPGQYIKHGADDNAQASGDATASGGDDNKTADKTNDADSNSGQATQTTTDGSTSGAQTMQTSDTTGTMSTQTTTMNEPPPFNPCPIDGSPCKIMPYGDSSPIS